MWLLGVIFVLFSEKVTFTEHDHDAWLQTCVEVTAKVKEREKLQQQSTSAPTTPIREHPTIEQLESLPVLTNGSSSSVQASSSVIIPGTYCIHTLNIFSLPAYSKLERFSKVNSL